MKTFNFDEFVHYGVHHGGNIVRGMPWAFKFYGHAVTHEDDNRYIICRVTADCRPNDIHFMRGDIIVVEYDGTLGHYRKG